MKRLLVLLLPFLLVVGCSDSSDLEARLARLEAENATLKEVIQASTATPTATPTPTATRTPTATPTPTATATGEPNEMEFVGPRVRYIADTGGDGVRPRSSCKASSPRQFEGLVVDGDQVIIVGQGINQCNTWYRVELASSGEYFWVSGDYLSSEAPITSGTPSIVTQVKDLTVTGKCQYEFKSFASWRGTVTNNTDRTLTDVQVVLSVFNAGEFLSSGAESVNYGTLFPDNTVRFAVFADTYDAPTRCDLIFQMGVGDILTVQYE